MNFDEQAQRTQAQLLALLDRINTLLSDVRVRVIDDDPQMRQKAGEGE